GRANLPEGLERVHGAPFLARLFARREHFTHAIEILVVREALHLVDEGGFAGEVVVNDALPEPELFADLGERRRAESFSRETLGGGIEDRSDPRVAPIHGSRSDVVALVGLGLGDLTRCSICRHVRLECWTVDRPAGGSAPLWR